MSSKQEVSFTPIDAMLAREEKRQVQIEQPAVVAPVRRSRKYVLLLIEPPTIEELKKMHKVLDVKTFESIFMSGKHIRDLLAQCDVLMVDYRDADSRYWWGQMAAWVEAEPNTFVIAKCATGRALNVEAANKKFNSDYAVKYLPSGDEVNDNDRDSYTERLESNHIASSIALGCMDAFLAVLKRKN
jgi:hypothetical protein